MVSCGFRSIYSGIIWFVLHKMKPLLVWFITEMCSIVLFGWRYKGLQILFFFSTQPHSWKPCGKWESGNFIYENGHYEHQSIEYHPLCICISIINFLVELVSVSHDTASSYYVSLPLFLANERTLTIVNFFWDLRGNPSLCCIFHNCSEWWSLV